MRAITIIMALALAGCATKEPGVQVRTVEVVTTRVEKCVAADDIPKPPAALGKRPTKDARVLADLLLSKVRAFEIYTSKVDPLLRGCAG